MTSERAAVDRASRDLRVFISTRESRCDDCGDDLGRHAMISLAGDRALSVSPARTGTTSRSYQAAGRPLLQVKTTIDFGEDGIPLERLGEIAKLLKARHVGAMSTGESGFVPISFDRYVDLTFRAIPRLARWNSPID